EWLRNFLCEICENLLDFFVLLLRIPDRPDIRERQLVDPLPVLLFVLRIFQDCEMPERRIAVRKLANHLPGAVLLQTASEKQHRPRHHQFQHVWYWQMEIDLRLRFPVMRSIFAERKDALSRKLPVAMQ